MTRTRLLTFTLLVSILSGGLIQLRIPGQVQIASASVADQTLNDDPPPGTIYLPLTSRSTASTTTPEWPMLAANPERTSWTAEEVSGALHVEWYRPIEAYIPQNVQLIASNGLIYVSTSRGLYALDASNGNVAWRFDTELPMGNSPTISSGVVYVGGFDRKLHALNAVTGAYLWSFDGAQAGYDTNPLVVNGKVILGNRDGSMYAIGAHGTINQGQLIWKFVSGGSIHLSAAYKNGVVYFAADDNHAYALNASDGSLLWKSAKLPGDGYHSFWPVVYQDKVVYSAAPGYRMGLNPGLNSITNSQGTTYGSIRDLERADIFYNAPLGATLGALLPAQDWSHGYPVMDGSRVTEYLEDNPTPNTYKYKPWRRTFIMLETSNGSEYTMDSDSDGRREYMPYAYWGTNSGNRYPPIVGPDGILYANNLYQNIPDAQGKVMGWKIGTKYLSLVGGQAAIAEPQAISMGGNLVYRNLCCDRLGDFFDIREDGYPSLFMWSYNLHDVAPGYDDMWVVFPGWPRLHGWYTGKSNSVNGIFHNTGDQNPLIPYAGRVYAHRSNAILAFGKGSVRGKLPTLEIAPGQNTSTPLTYQDLQMRLEIEIEKMLAAGHLRPGYYNIGQFSTFSEIADYFKNPGDTLYTLSIAYPHLSTDLQIPVKDYLQQHFSQFFDPVMHVSTGWAEGAAREAMPLPPEVEAVLPNFPKREFLGGFSWTYPPHNFYAMWKYALIVPDQIGQIYGLAKSKLQVPVPSIATNDYFRLRPFELNAYITGYIGFLELQELAGTTQADAQIRSAVTSELDRLLRLRANNFQKDTPWNDDRYHNKVLNIARNFMMIVPELGEYLNTHALARVQEAIDEYEYIAPTWFVSRNEVILNEGAMSPLYNYAAIFQAKAFILEENRDTLSRYLDVPGFAVGDLLYLQNLVAAMEAP